MSEFVRLFQPGRIGSVEASNRIIMPAMGTAHGEKDGTVGDSLVNYFVRRAEGGCGIVMTEITNVHPTGSVPGVPNIYDDRFIPGLARLASGVKEHGALAFMQLYHPGRQSSSMMTGQDLVAPSAIPTRPANEVPKPASIELIKEIVEGFVHGAERAKAAGFDGIEVHGAHGYLLCAFLSPRSNKRDDEYGGDTARRARIVTEIIQKTRSRLPDFPIVFRLSAEEMVPGGIALPEAIVIAKLAEQAGADAISVSAGCYDAIDGPTPPMSKPRACYEPLASEIRRAVGVPVIMAGRIDEPALAEEMLANGAADFIGIGRGLLADPDFAKKAKEGRASEIRRCLACNSCLDLLLAGRPIRCIVNYELGREYKFSYAKAEQPKRVAVVGGGPGGMAAAALLAERGHAVTLYERDEVLGGKIPLCAAEDWKKGYDKLRVYLEDSVAKEGVQVKLGQTVTVDLLAQEEPDAIVLATGAESMVPEVPGLDREKAITAEDVLLGKVVVGQRVFIMGGGYTACELALLLARRGHHVTLARRSERFGRELGRSGRWTIIPELEELGVRMIPGVTYEQITTDGVVLNKNGEREAVPADTVICATGYRSNSGLVDELSGRPNVYAIGDCVQPRKLLDALHEAVEVAIRI